MHNMKMGIKTKTYSQRGQTTIEYILLIAVVIGLATFILNLPIMQKFLGKDGQGGFTSPFFASMQYSYRHAIFGTNKEIYPANYQQAKHDSYSSGTDTRFFGPADPYP